MDSLVFTKCQKATVLTLFLIVIFSTTAVTAIDFKVGSRKGWTKPTANDTETYNNWATQQRIHIGDTLYFKYQNDTVLVVNRTDYENCISLNPISEYEDGNTKFQLNRHGYFYFISGQPLHCKAGQKMVVRVMVHPRIESTIAGPPADSPGPSPDGNDGWDSSDSGSHSISSANKLSIASYSMPFLIGIFLVVYLFM